MPPRVILYEASSFLAAITKIKSENYAADPTLAWGSIKVMLQTRSLEELRAKLAELNVALRQVGIDEEKGFIDERLLIGDRLLQKNAIPLLTQYAKRGIPHALRPAMYKKILNADYGEKVILIKVMFNRAQYTLRNSKTVIRNGKSYWTMSSGLTSRNFAMTTNISSLKT